MKLSPVEQRKILAVEAIDEQIDLATNQKESAEGRLAELASDRALLALQTEARSIQDDIDTKRVELRQIEADTAVVEQRLARDESLLHASSSVKSVGGIQSEIASLEVRKSHLEDEQLEIMDVLEAVEASLTGKQNEIEQIEQSHYAEAAEFRATVDRTNEASVQLTHDRTAIVDGVDPALLSTYTAIRSKNGMRGAAEFDGTLCPTYRIELDPEDRRAIATAPKDDVVLCPSCGCILIRS